jgi:hypothetical protein
VPQMNLRLTPISGENSVKNMFDLVRLIVQPVVR